MSWKQWLKKITKPDSCQARETQVCVHHFCSEIPSVLTLLRALRMQRYFIFFNIAGIHTDHITQPLCFIKHLSKHWTWIYILKASGCFIFMKDKLIKLKSIAIWDSMGGLAFFAFLKSFCTQRQKQTSGCQAILFWREKKAGNVATTMHKKNVDLHKTSVALSRKLSCIYNPFSLWALLR